MAIRTGPRGHAPGSMSSEVVDAALGLAGAGPAAAALVVARRAGGARLAADAGVAGVEQGVVGDVVVEEVAPGVLAGPRDQRRDLDDEAAALPPGGAEDRGALARLGLIAANGGDPDVEAIEDPPHRLDLA